MIDLVEVFEFFASKQIEVIRKDNDNFSTKIRNAEVLIPASECESYFRIKDQITIPTETSIFFPGYYEHYIENLNHYGILSLFRNDEREISTESPDGNSKIVISPISYNFIISHLDKQQFNRILYRYNSLNRRRTVDGSNTLGNICERILSIKVYLKPGHRYYNHKDQLQKLAESGLFNFSYNLCIAFNLASSWEKSYFRLTKTRSREIQFPQRIYNSDLIAYYQLALSSESLMLSYLGLYKILEHFFITATEKVLHKRIADLLASPDFSYKKSSKLRQLTSLVRKYDQKTNELQMLATVLENNFVIDEITDWVQNFEKENGTYYTTAQTFLGEVYSLDKNPEHIFSSLAKRIYNIRNVLVHSKEGEMPKYIPFSGQEEFIANELPILLFLAESIIIKTGNDIQL